MGICEGEDEIIDTLGVNVGVNVGNKVGASIIGKASN